MNCTPPSINVLVAEAIGVNEPLIRGLPSQSVVIGAVKFVWTTVNDVVELNGADIESDSQACHALLQTLADEVP